MGRILVVGGSGMLGSYVTEQAVAKGWETFATYTSHEVAIPGSRMLRMDCRRPDDAARVVSEVRPDAVIHTAAICRPDVCEERRGDAFALNVLGVCNMLAAAETVGAHFVQVSTDLVFNGERSPFQEDDPLSPVNYYGLTKAAAEAAVLGSRGGAAIVRSSTIYGARKFPFLHSYSDAVIEGLRTRTMVPAFVDQYRQNVPAWNVADVLLEIAERRLTGIFHAVCPDVTTRFQLATRIAGALGLDAGYLNPISMNEVKAVARRPKMLVIDMAGTARALNTPLLSFDEGIEELKRRFEEGR